MKNILICYDEHFDEIDAKKVVERLKGTKPNNIIFHKMETSYPDIFGGALREVLRDMLGSYESIPIPLTVESFLNLDPIICKALSKITYKEIPPQDYVRKLSERLPKISKRSGVPVPELKKMSLEGLYHLCSNELAVAEIKELIDKETGVILNVHQRPYNDKGSLELLYDHRSKILKRVLKYLDDSIIDRNLSEEMISIREVNFKEYGLLEVCAYKSRAEGYKNLLQFLCQVFSFLT